MTLKILITHELFPPDISGGGEKLVYNLTKALVKRGHSVKVLTSGNSKIKKYGGIRTIRVPINRYLMNLTAFIIAYHARDVDIVATSSGNTCFPSWIAAKLMDKPICCYVHHILGSYWIDVKGKVLGKIFEFAEKIFLNRSYDAIIFQNKSSKKIGLGMGIDKNRIFMLQPGIDYKKFQMKGVKKESFVLFVGNLSMDKAIVETKGLKYLIEAAKKLSNIKFVVVGEGDYLLELKQNSPSNVVFKGKLVGRPLIKLYNRALIYCLPSLNEGFGTTILEAMASGCSIISTINLGQEGAILRPKNTKDIIKAIEHRVNNPKIAILEGKKNKRIVKKFMWDKFVTELIRIYNSVSKIKHI